MKNNDSNLYAKSEVKEYNSSGIIGKKKLAALIKNYIWIKFDLPRRLLYSTSEASLGSIINI